MARVVRRRIPVGEEPEKTPTKSGQPARASRKAQEHSSNADPALSPADAATPPTKEQAPTAESAPAKKRKTVKRSKKASRKSTKSVKKPVEAESQTPTHSEKSKKSQKTQKSAKKPHQTSAKHHIHTAKRKERREEQDEDPQGSGTWLAVAAVIGILVVVGLLVFMGQPAETPASPNQTEEPTSTATDAFTFDPDELSGGFPVLLDKMRQLDKEYLTDLHQERLGKDMINPIFIKPYVEKIDELWAAVNESHPDPTQMDVMQNFLEARRRMLISQLYFQEGLKFGTRGAVTESFDCRYTDELKEATELYNQSLEIGRWALPRLDQVLRESPYAQEQLGVNTQKMRWYVNRFGDIKRLVDTNTWAIEKFCPLRKSLNSSVEFNDQNTQADPTAAQDAQKIEDSLPGVAVE